ncbi:BrnT family toxin [Ekhidna sp.]|uniref:BrnT family toxin n=1 Tax=Ekhidna sp. TaxID=2608089 RepID=UPI003CCBA7FC
MWEDEAGYTIPSTHHGEDRKLLIGKVGKKEWTAIFTHRNEKIRLISVRRSRKNEKKLYISRRTR